MLLIWIKLMVLRYMLNFNEIYCVPAHYTFTSPTSTTTTDE